MGFLKELFEKKDKKTFINIFIAIAVGIGFILIGGVIDGGDERAPDNEEDEVSSEDIREDYRRSMERELEGIFGVVEGVGRIKVMITFKDEGEKRLAEDTQREKSSGGTGGNLEREETKVLLSQGNSPYIINRSCPEVEGVLITCEGGGNVRIRSSLINGCTALFGIEANKTEVLKMGGS